MKIRLNPIVKKDLQVAARSMRISWGLFAYEALLTMAFLLALVIIQNESSYFYYSDSNIYSDLVYLFPVVAVVQVCIVALIVPIITASSISGEKERQTFDIMLTTCMSPLSIVTGKVTSAVIRILFFVVASMPIMALSFVVGGLSWGNLLLFVLAVILLSVFSGSIGILCSAFCRKSITAVIMSFAIYFVIYGMSFAPLLGTMLMTGDYAGESMLVLLFNPMVFFEEFFSLMMTGESLINEISFSRKDVGFITYHLTQSDMWVYVSAVAIVLLSVVFMLIAAWKVNPMNARGGKKRKKG